MPSENNSTIHKLLFAFVALIVGIVLIGVVADQTNSISSKTNVANETFSLTSCYNATGNVNTSNSNCNKTLANAPTDWKVYDCPLTSLSIKNSTGTALTLTTDYKANLSTGKIEFLNGADNATVMAGNNSYVFYTYCQNGYLTTDFGRSSIMLVAGFFAIGLLLTSVGLFYSVGKDMGII